MNYKTVADVELHPLWKKYSKDFREWLKTMNPKTRPIPPTCESIVWKDTGLPVFPKSK